MDMKTKICIDDYKYRIAPLVRKIYDDFNSICSCLSVWVTDYGFIDGDEIADEDILRIITQDGSCEVGSAYYCIDISFTNETKEMHEAICYILGVSDFYETSCDTPWYRLDSSNLEDYINRLSAVKAYLASARQLANMRDNRQLRLTLDIDDIPFILTEMANYIEENDLTDKQKTQYFSSIVQSKLFEDVFGKKLSFITDENNRIKQLEINRPLSISESYE